MLIHDQDKRQDILRHFIIKEIARILHSPREVHQNIQFFKTFFLKKIQTGEEKLGGKARRGKKNMVQQFTLAA